MLLVASGVYELTRLPARVMESGEDILANPRLSSRLLPHNNPPRIPF